MLFNSLGYLFFFPIVVGLYFLVPVRWRWVLLLVVSYIFYMSWEPRHGILLFFYTLVSYFTAIFIQRTTEIKMKRLVLFSGLSLGFGLLFAFKYF
ncbi:MAG TPA: MBOAT family protein, partial [Patescibacteria group bacterium]|nr:MBOAT family protein [Patescibacteria group bacterium]